MSDSEDLLISTQEPAGRGVCSPPAPSPPPPYSNHELPPPPPYSAAPPRYDPAKVATDSSSLSSAGYESFMDLRLEASSDTTPLMCSSAFDDKAVRRGFIRKVCATVSFETRSQWGLNSSTCPVSTGLPHSFLFHNAICSVTALSFQNILIWQNY